jgi:hypothetical protein
MKRIFVFLVIAGYANATPCYLDFSKLDFGVKDLKLIPFDQKPAYIDLSK